MKLTLKFQNSSFVDKDSKSGKHRAAMIGAKLIAPKPVSHVFIQVFRPGSNT